MVVQFYEGVSQAKCQFYEDAFGARVQFYEEGALFTRAMQRGRGFGFMSHERSTNNNFLAHFLENEYNRNTK